jgi:diguanylate cyclase (GGDEF)-like protein
MTLKHKILLLGLAALASLAIVLWNQYDRYDIQQRKFDTISSNVQRLNALSQAVHELQKERGLSTMTLAGLDTQAVLAQHGATDSAMRTLATVHAADGALQKEVPALRATVLAGGMTPLEARDGYTRLIQQLTDRMSSLTNPVEPPFAKDDISAHARLVLAKEYLGQMRATVGYLLESGRDDALALQSLMRLKGLFDEELRKFALEATPEIADALSAHFFGADVARTLNTIEAFSALESRSVGLTPTAWWATATATIDRMKDAEDQALLHIVQESGDKLTEIRRNMLVGVVLTLLLSTIVLILTVSSIAGLLRALDRMLASMEQIAATQDFAVRIPVDGEDEIRRISRSFNNLLEIADRLLGEKDYLATHDPLTGLHNRRSFAHALAQEVERKRRNSGTMTLILFDIDLFKRINDTYGHDTGDEVLKSIARLVEGAVRNIDFVGRWGGEEFVLLLRDDGQEAGVVLAEKLRQMIETQVLPQVGQITCSFGVASWRDGEREDLFVKRADEALYRAKQGGRNLVCGEEQNRSAG